MGEDRIIDINKAKEREEFLDRKGKDIPDPRMIGNPNIDQLKELMKFLPTATEIPDTATMNQSEQKQNKRSTGLGDILANIGKLAFAIPFAPAINAYYDTRKSQATDFITQQATNVMEQNPDLTPNQIAFNLQKQFPEIYKQANISDVLKNVQGMTQGVQMYTDKDLDNRMSMMKTNQKAFDYGGSTPNADFKDRGWPYFSEYAKKFDPELGKDGKLYVSQDAYNKIMDEARAKRISPEYLKDKFGVPEATEDPLAIYERKLQIEMKYKQMQKEWEDKRKPKSQGTGTKNKLEKVFDILTKYDVQQLTTSLGDKTKAFVLGMSDALSGNTKTDNYKEFEDNLGVLLSNPIKTMTDDEKAELQKFLNNKKNRGGAGTEKLVSIRYKKSDGTVGVNQVPESQMEEAKKIIIDSGGEIL